jgi:hypothetical protein
VLVERNAAELDAALHPSPAAPVKDPWGFALSALSESLALVAPALAADRESLGAGGDPHDDGYFRAFYTRQREALASRLGAAASATGSLWLTAWELAGRPVPPGEQTGELLHFPERLAGQ